VAVASINEMVLEGSGREISDAAQQLQYKWAWWPDVVITRLLEIYS
jgi:hypothetical protein